MLSLFSGERRLLLRRNEFAGMSYISRRLQRWGFWRSFQSFHFRYKYSGISLYFSFARMVDNVLALDASSKFDIRLFEFDILTESVVRNCQWRSNNIVIVWSWLAKFLTMHSKCPSRTLSVHSCQGKSKVKCTRIWNEKFLFALFFFENFGKIVILTSHHRSK